MVTLSQKSIWPDAEGAAKEDVQGFDEDWYLRVYPDVAAGVSRGDVRSGHEHYMRWGREEGRLPSPSTFDEAWYAASYPIARRDIEAGSASSYAEHYALRGHARGYLPNRFAARPTDPTALKSRFGGFWPDRGNALDLVEGKREIGMINDEQAEQLRNWIDRGYVVLHRAIPAELLDRAEKEFDRAYRGEIPTLRFSCPAIAGHHQIIPWEELVTQEAAKGLDLHWLSPGIRDLIFAPAVRQFLELIFERRVLASQSLAFLRGSAQSHHMDTFYVPYTSPMQFAASWIALEDVGAGAGELAYLEGSHKFPEHLLDGEYKSVHEFQRMTRNINRDPGMEFGTWLADVARTQGTVEKTFLARRGDVLIWHAGLAHGGKPISQKRTRKSVVAHYCPREIAPLAWEQHSQPLRSYQDVAWYSTGYYRDSQHH